MQPVEIQLPLLGERNYLHGTTLFDAMMRCIPKGAAVSFKIARRIDSDRVRLQLADAMADASASLSWSRGAKSGILVAIGQVPSVAPHREQYDEAAVETRAVLGGKTALLRDAPPYGLVQALIPLYKALLKREVATTVAGQWMFTRLDLSALPHVFVPLELVLAGTIPNALARAHVRCAGASLGMLYFSWVKRT